MTPTTLKSLHTYLKLLENAAELKRKMPGSSNQRSMKEGLSEMSKLVDIDAATLQDPQNIAAAIGQQRFVMIWGEPFVTAHVARIFDGAKLLFTVLVDQGHFERSTAASASSHPDPMQRQAPAKSSPASWAQSKAESSGSSSPEREIALDSLKPLMAGKVTLFCRLFRVLFEHLLGSASQSSAQQGSALLVNELAGSKEHGRSFLASAMFVLGTEVDRENLMPFLLAQGLFGIQILEHLLQNREYCDAYYSFRRLERAFLASPVEEDARLMARIDELNARFGGKPCGQKLFERSNPDKTAVDAHLAAADLLEAMSFTSWSLSLNNAIAVDSSNSIRSIKTIAGHFERFANGAKTAEQTNQEIADHLLAFARQFSADSKPA
jgi:hypothetical protein